MKYEIPIVSKLGAAIGAFLLFALFVAGASAGPNCQFSTIDGNGAQSVSDSEVYIQVTKLMQSDPAFYHLCWFGIRTQQFPLDTWMIQEIICEQKPDFIVETGTLNGGSATLWAMILEHINPYGRVLTIDITNQVEQNKIPKNLANRISFFLGSSVDPKIVARVRKITHGKNVMVILDSDHRKDHVLKEIESYSPMIGVGGYLIVQDTLINGHPAEPSWGPGPWEAVHQFLETNTQFKPDPYRERLRLTGHPDGYLKRVR
jgi:cephalosporin hydroxylase